MLTALTTFKTSIQAVIYFADHINANTSQSLKNKEMRDMFQTMRCAAVVAVSGYFEYFLKELAKGFITYLNTKSVPFSALPDRIKFAHFINGGAALSKNAEREKENPSHNQPRRTGTTTCVCSCRERVSACMGSFHRHKIKPKTKHC